MGEWIEPSPEEVGARYDRLAPIYYAFEWLHALPIVRIRSRAVDAMRLSPGDAVLEVGCGDGLNFARIERRIGPEGALFGIDMSQRMLARAERRAARHGWRNLTLTRGDALAYTPPRPPNAALFCFSYSTMRDRSAIVRRVFDLLAPGGRLVVADTYLNPGFMRRRFLSTSNWVSSRTLYGKPDTDPLADLASLGGELTEERISMWPYGSQFVIARATMPRA